MKFLSYKSSSKLYPVIGLLDASGEKVTPLLFPNRRPVTSLHHLIERWEDVSDKLLPGLPTEDVSEVEILAPLRGRDVLCVGKNYKDHAAEFHKSGYDSSDVKAQPDYPVIFTKRATSIIPHGAKIYPHPNATDTLDYEGELGVIVGKGGIGIKSADAWDHVWGAVIVNDFTARERQRDHKQFYIGKSLDTFCPMGPYVVHASALNWKDMELITKVNGEIRQQQKTSELIFDIPTLIETCSLGITLQPGDLIATGTPAGVCLSSGKFLQPGDQIDISITGLGTLSNQVGPIGASAPAYQGLREVSDSSSASPDERLVSTAAGRLHINVSGDKSGPTLLCIHGLGGNATNWEPLIAAASLEKTHKIVTFDFEGHGLSPLSGDGLTVESLAESVRAVLDNVGSERAVIVGHSMGGLVATTFASLYPASVNSLFLVGPVRQFPEAGYKALTSRASTVRKGGMAAVAPSILAAGTSATTQQSRPLAKGYISLSLLASEPEGYAQACEALATATNPAYDQIKAKTLILAGAEDKTSPAATWEFLSEQIKGAKVVKLENVGHWHMIEDVEGSAAALKAFLSD